VLKLKEVLSQASLRITTTFLRKGYSVPTIVCLEAKLMEVWNSWEERIYGSVRASEVKNLRETLKSLVICPIDKCTSEAMMMCPRKWMEAVRNLSSTMCVVTAREENLVYSYLFQQGKRLIRLPFCRLQKAWKHKFANLKGWVKLKSIIADPKEWSELSWRPLQGYQNHRWKKLLSLVDKFCTAAIRTLEWGFGVETPRQVIEKLNKFNQLTQSTCLVENISIDVFDIKEFFTHASQSILKS